MSEWISRQQVADRYDVPVKTVADWAAKGAGPRYAKFGKHARYRLEDVIAWEESLLEAQDARQTALAAGPTWEDITPEDLKRRLDGQVSLSRH